jgi:hypothetical protein
MKAANNLSPYKASDRPEPLDDGFIGTIFDSDQAAPVLTRIPDPPELMNAVLDVLYLAEQGQNIIPALVDLCILIPVNICKALSPTFLLSAFPEIHLEPITGSPLFQLIYGILDTSTDSFLLSESARLIASCAYASKDCIRSMANLGFLDLLFSCIPRVFLLSFPEVIFDILSALTLIWKRLSSIDFPTTLSTEQLNNLFLITRPLCGELRVPFMRLISCLLVSGSLDSSQRLRLTAGIHVIFYGSFHINPNCLEAESPGDLGDLAEIAIALSRSECVHKRLIVSPSHPFIGISQVLHLLPLQVAARFLFFYDECDRFCDDRMMHELLVALDCKTLVDFLDLGIPRLTEASLNVISLIIERNCIEPEIIFERIIPSVIDPLLESLVSERFCLKRSALRFFHATVVCLDWSVFPDAAFEHFMTTTQDFISSQNKTESFWVLESLLVALRIQIPEFFDFVTRICDNLNIPSTLEELRGMDDPVFHQLFIEIDSILGGPEVEPIHPFLA